MVDLLKLRGITVCVDHSCTALPYRFQAMFQELFQGPTYLYRTLALLLVLAALAFVVGRK